MTYVTYTVGAIVFAIVTMDMRYILQGFMTLKIFIFFLLSLFTLPQLSWLCPPCPCVVPVPRLGPVPWFPVLLVATMHPGQ